MHDNEKPIIECKRVPWNKGKLTGPRPPLRQKHIWAIRTRLQIDRETRDLALFNLAIDSKPRGCDLVAVKVDDVAPGGHAVARATVRQKHELPLAEFCNTSEAPGATFKTTRMTQSGHEQDTAGAHL